MGCRQLGTRVGCAVLKISVCRLPGMFMWPWRDRTSFAIYITTATRWPALRGDKGHGPQPIGGGREGRGRKVPEDWNLCQVRVP